MPDAIPPRADGTKPAPSINLRPRPANRGRPAFPAVSVRKMTPGGADHDVGPTQHPKADIVVTVVRIDVVASRRARVVCFIVPRATAHHAGQVSGDPTKRRDSRKRNICASQRQYAREQRPTQKNRAPLRGASEQQTSDPVSSAPAFSYSMGDQHNTRKPRRSRRLTGLM
jgi:hypothetical protein